mmetsp:Transcript_12970/g.39167  ORF Transcript_12970/g.39167 Transcript_12970/m.39167 type:complete len:212 (-) Transcript_12970:101-736(-)
MTVSGARRGAAASCLGAFLASLGGGGCDSSLEAADSSSIARTTPDGSSSVWSSSSGPAGRRRASVRSRPRKLRAKSETGPPWGSRARAASARVPKNVVRSGASTRKSASQSAPKRVSSASSFTTSVGSRSSRATAIATGGAPASDSTESDVSFETVSFVRTAASFSFAWAWARRSVSVARVKRRQAGSWASKRPRKSPARRGGRAALRRSK